MLRVDFLRHGELEGGVKYRGCLDEMLTAQGIESMHKVWSCVQAEVTQIISSPLSRCAEPAIQWSEEVHVPCVLDARIQELYYGAWEGMTFQEVEACTPQLLKQWREDPTHLTPPKGESMQAFAQRTQAFLDELIEQEKEGHVLVVAHSGSIRLMLAQTMKASIQSTRHLAMPYACWSRIEVHQGQAQLVFHGREII